MSSPGGRRSSKKANNSNNIRSGRLSSVGRFFNPTVVRLEGVDDFWNRPQLSGVTVFNRPLGASVHVSNPP
ncbi:hypothetical protein SLEP1_g19646 [Rubroshorea leprosula]|uniref:Uncharacterized protein n=1 Tax=Rubroshorea leprosula TaxID=152421 RepID=A0AAV5JAP6_9ROSI|nr:hypothetical protein SLEP1_g19646 [Rubroshorea leprosula]